MYNRYVPQADGSFRKTKLPEPDAMEAAEFTQSVLPFSSAAEESVSPANTGPVGIGSFLKGLLPRELDTEDLIVILLLLLLSGNQGKGGNQALLTLGAYLFL